MEEVEMDNVRGMEVDRSRGGYFEGDTVYRRI